MLGRQDFHTFRTVVALLVFTSCATLFTSIAYGQPNLPQDTKKAEQTKEQEVEPDSPRASVENYLGLCREGHYDQAARYLDLSEATEGDGAVLAKKLKAVLERSVSLDPETLSPSSRGDIHDELRRSLEKIGEIRGPEGKPEPILMQRYRSASGPSWVFSAATVARINDWYDGLQKRWIVAHLPDALLGRGPGNLLWWQWLTLITLVIIASAVGFTLSKVTRAILTKITSHTAATWDDNIVERIAGPLTLLWTVAVAKIGILWLELYEPAQTILNKIMRSGVFLAIFWLLFRLVEVAGHLAFSSWTIDHPAARALVPLGARISKIVIFALALVAFLSELGFSVASLIAGLGLGGLALALAAQKTVEHLFGAVSIGIDQPFRQGDAIKVDNIVGSVETIGLRSTRIRTPDRTLITIPNGKLADAQIESYSVRDRLRLSCLVRLEYGTTAAQVQQVIAKIEGTLRAHPKIWPDDVMVRLVELAEYSLNIEVGSWFMTRDWSEFLAIRQELLIAFMEIVENAKASFAFPSRSIYIEEVTKKIEPSRG